MSLASSLRGFLPRPDPRSDDEIKDDIAAEIEFHLAEATDELAAMGLDHVEARRRALERFGDVERVRAECHRAQTGDRNMLIRIQFVVIAVLGLAALALGVSTWQFRVASLRAEEAARAAMAEAMQSREQALAAAAENSARAASARVESAVHARDPVEDERSARDSASDEARSMSERVRDWFQADRDNWRVGLSAAQRIADQFEPLVALELMRELYPYLSVEHREQVFKPFVFHGGHPQAIAVLDLGARDSTGSVRERAFHYLRDYAFRDFSADFDAYDDWYRRVAALPLGDVFALSASSTVERLFRAQGEELKREMRVLSDLDLRAARKHGGDPAHRFREAGLLELIDQWLASNQSSHVVFALRAAGWLELDSEEHARHLDGLFERDWSELDSGAIIGEYCRLVGVRGNGWAVDRMLRFVEAYLVTRGSTEVARSACTALGEIGETSAIPRLIDALRLADSPARREAIGYWALRPLTGVVHDESHDADWWTQWWTDNSSRFEK